MATSLPFIPVVFLLCFGWRVKSAKEKNQTHIRHESHRKIGWLGMVAWEKVEDKSCPTE